MATVKTFKLIILVRQEQKKGLIQKHEMSTIQFTVMLYRSITCTMLQLQTQAWAPTDMGKGALVPWKLFVCCLKFK